MAVASPGFIWSVRSYVLPTITESHLICIPVGKMTDTWLFLNSSAEQNSFLEKIAFNVFTGVFKIMSNESLFFFPLKLNVWHFEKNHFSSVQHYPAKWHYLKKKMIGSELESCWNQLYIPHCPVLLPYHIQALSKRMSLGLPLCKCHPTSDVTLKMSPHYPFH